MESSVPRTRGADFSDEDVRRRGKEKVPPATQPSAHHPPMGFIVIHTVYIAWAVLFFWVWYLRVPIGKGLRRVNRFSRGLIGR